MVTDNIYHYCLTCHNSTIYHKFNHESTGDRVRAYCENCGQDTLHAIGEYHHYND